MLVVKSMTSRGKTIKLASDEYAAIFKSLRFIVDIVADIIVFVVGLVALDYLLAGLTLTSGIESAQESIMVIHEKT